MSSNDLEKAGLKKENMDDVTVSSSSDDSDIDMPLFKYARLVGSLPRLPPSNAFSSPCTCSAMGKVVLTPDVLDGSVTDGMALQKRQSDLVWMYPHYVLAMGFQNGLLSLVDARTGAAIVPSDQLKESRVESVVDVGFDASGTHLAALYANGMCAIWELRYAASVTTPTTEPSTTNTNTTTTVATELSSDKVFSWFKGASATTTTTTAVADASLSPTHEPTRTPIPTLKTITCQASRISYPSSFGPPTCMAIDPSYKRKREKTILVGFRDGRLVMTKRGFFQRRNDGVIYQGTCGTIERITWRGPLVAWADDSGIKLFDVDTMTRIAKIDRPSGARASLYPTISSLRPSFLFETSDSLLCVWGDCLMSMTIQETTVSRHNAEDPSERSDAAAAAGGGSGPQEANMVKRRSVQCTMAWELDCVACGVVPLDEEHVAVLGLVPTGEEETGPQANDLELHVMSRSEGTITYADALPLIQSPNSSGKDATSGYMLLSSFGLPRMEDTVEAEEDRILNGDDQEIDFQMTLFSSSTKSEPFKDSHKKWSLKQLAFEDDAGKYQISDPDVDAGGNDIGKDGGKPDEEDGQSVDSDDYSFVFRPSQPAQIQGLPSPSVFPPLMVIMSPSDAVLVRTREVDDAVSHALSAKKYGLALRRALTHKRQLREHDINHLIDKYLWAMLRMKEVNDVGANKGSERADLSIRRVNLAAQAMPMLLGGNIRMWDRWVDEFSKIPGGLFILRWELPVRDPILPAKVYEIVLQTMLSEIEGVLAAKAKASESHDYLLLYPQMMSHYLSALIAWGPTRSLREKIQLHKYNVDRKRKKAGSAELLEDPVLIDAEKSLDRRLHQTASGYLQLPSPPSLHRPGSSAPLNAPSPSVNDSSDSLFDVDSVLAQVSVHVPLLAANDQHIGAETANNHAALEAMAELNMMKGRYEMALKCFLAIGCLHVTPDVSTVEETAIVAVNGGVVPKAARRNQYGFVLAMIEYQHLHQCLLDDNFLAASVNDKTQNISTPLIALIQLVGLDSASDFLVEHCVPPPDKKAPSSPAFDMSSTTDERKNRHETLPINLVADQLRANPKLFHWYLHQIFVHKPEMYVKFPSSAVPPRSVTELHRSHLELYIEYTDKRDSAEALSGTETYNLERMTTPLLTFLKAALPLGGIRPDEVRRLIEAERTGNKQGILSDVVQFPHYFAIELAYVIEHFGKDSEEDAKQILDLYLKGSKSLMLAVSYAQRNTTFGSQLWAILIDHCLTSAQDEDGSLFGSLLECAAQCGADLAHLVTQIPQGMQIEGLRPRLVAAVADYRWKLKMHEAASSIGTNERIVLLRELAHRSKRGMRFSKLATSDAADGMSPPASPSKDLSQSSKAEVATIPNRPLERPNRYRLAFPMPIR